MLLFFRFAAGTIFGLTYFKLVNPTDYVDPYGTQNHFHTIFFHLSLVLGSSKIYRSDVIRLDGSAIVDKIFYYSRVMYGSLRYFALNSASEFPKCRAQVDDKILARLLVLTPSKNLAPCTKFCAMPSLV